MIKLYMDHHVRRAITEGLRARGIEVLTAYEDDHHKMSDSVVLDRANALGYALFSQDDDLLAEATRRQRAGIPFPGVIYGHQRRVSTRQCIRDLEVIAKAAEQGEIANDVIYLPL